MEKVRKYKNDLLLITGLAVIALSVLFLMSVFSEGGKSVRIEVSGAVLTVLPLTEDQEYRVDFPDDEFNLIRIQNGEVSVKDSSCPDRICVHHSPVKADGETIICLPHKLAVTVSGEASGGMK